MNGPTDECPSNARPAHRRWWRSPLLTAGCRYLLGAVFLMAAVSKVIDLRGFEDRLLESGYLPYAVAVAIARILPWVELTCGVCLLLGVAAREAALCVAVLLLLFIGHSFLSRDQTDCGCFLSPLPEPTAANWWPLLRNVLLFLSSLRVIWGKEGPHSSASSSSKISMTG